jgi:hypothetical protein
VLYSGDERVNAFGCNGLTRKLWHNFHHRINEKNSLKNGAKLLGESFPELDVQKPIWCDIGKMLKSPCTICVRKFSPEISLAGFSSAAN